MSACAHNAFAAHVEVARLTADDSDDRVIAYAATTRVSCAECGLPFCFPPELPFGISTTRPTINIDGTELRCPLRPAVMVKSS
jgi:hypothetical protein